MTHHPHGTPRPRSGAFHTRTHVSRARGGGLGLRECLAMAVGGMIGGGIFSVLGVTVDLAGHLAWVTFIVGGAIAMLTARSYARLALHSGRSGGPFAYLRDEGHGSAAAWVGWLLVLGYVFALAVYAYTFGHYLANVLGAPLLVARLTALAVLGGFVVVNLRGVGTSGLTEDLVVLGKLVILGGIAVVGLAQTDPGRLTGVPGGGWSGVLIGAGVVFVAYEGFELLPYDYGDIDRPGRTLPLALYGSVAFVTAVYVVVTVGSLMLVDDRTLVEGKETAFAVVGDHALGTAGLWIASFGALLSASSAINATLFSTARLVQGISAAHELPHHLARERLGVPADAILVLAVLGGVFSLVPGVGAIVAFGSLTFLTVFALINGMHARHTAHGPLDRCLAWAGAAGCTAGATALIWHLATTDVGALVLAAASGTVLGGLRVLFTRVSAGAAPPI